MSEHTGIEWTDHTFSIAWGCVKVSPGCAHCYADNSSRRFGFKVFGPAQTTQRRTFGAAHWLDPLKWNRKAEKAGRNELVFCSSMCDVFEDHPQISAERERLWPLIRRTPWLTWQLLTKRPERIAANLPDDWGSDGAAHYPNVWLGTSVESQDYVHRASILAEVPFAGIRFLSCEPLIGPLDLTQYVDGERSAWRALNEIDWCIIGGESQPGCRPMDPAWAEQIVADCDRYGVPAFVKQLGGHPDKRGHEQAIVNGRRYTEMPSDFQR